MVVVAGGRPVRKFDLALMVDTTGSMGDELEYLKSELRAVVDRLKRDHPQLDIRVALVFYRDTADEYVTRTFPFTTALDRVEADLSAQHADAAETQAISAMVYAATDLDGIAYRSRLDPDQLCVALFDRADHKIELVNEGEFIDLAWVDDLLEPRGKHVVDP